MRFYAHLSDYHLYKGESHRLVFLWGYLAKYCESYIFLLIKKKYQSPFIVYIVLSLKVY